MNDIQTIQGKNRIEYIDVIRGIAVLGILLVNMAHFSYPDLYLYMVGSDNFFTKEWSNTDQITVMVLNTFVQMKFITMFSFLFGFGMVIMMDRAEVKGQKFLPVYIRRLLALLLFGVIHAFFIWDGDILMDYALLGFILLLFRKCRPKTLLVWTIILYSLFTILIGLSTNAPMQESAEMIEWQAELIAKNEQEAKQALHVYSQGTLIEISKQRIHDRMYYMSMNGMATLNPVLFFFSNIPYFSMFLLGAYFAKRKILHDPYQYRSLLKKIWFLSLMIGIPCNIIFGVTENETFLLIGAPFLMLFYVITIVFLFHYDWGRKAFLPFAAVGRTAFTNYIMQSVIATTLFYSYGFGWYGKVNPFVGLFIALAIFFLQLFISNLWLRIFRFGPLEWIWRALTYKKVPQL